MDQTFTAGKEHLVIIDRFLWCGEIQKHNVMEVVKRREPNYSVCIPMLQRL